MYAPAMLIEKSVTSITSTDGAVGETEVDFAGDVVNYSIVVTNDRQCHIDRRDSLTISCWAT